MISIIIPSKNRHNFLKRAINYYIFINKKIEIVIIDSSKKKINFKKIKNSKVKLKIYHKPNLDPYEAMVFGAKKASNKYVAYTGDDDFLIIKTAEKAVNFLKKNKEYSAVTGKSLVFFIKNNYCFGKIERCEEYLQFENNSKSRIVRIKSFFNNYNVNLFSICRKDIFLKSLKFAKIFKANYSLKAEIIICFAIIFFGRLKKLNNYYLIRQNFSVNKRIQNLPSPGSLLQLKNYLKILMEFEKEISLYSNDQIKIRKILHDYLKNDFAKTNKNIFSNFKLIKLLYFVLKKLKFLYKSKNTLNKKLLLKNFLNENEKLKKKIYI